MNEVWTGVRLRVGVQGDRVLALGACGVSPEETTSGRTKKDAQTEQMQMWT